MGILGAKAYDPAVAVSKATTSRLVMTAIDTTNLRITFTAPANGKVLLRLKGQVHGATTFPRILLGVLDGATVRGRMAPMGQQPSSLATTQLAQEIICVITGLTPSASYTWDAAYGVEILLASTGLKYGGPNNASGNNAWGAFIFEIWETRNLLGAIFYDPASAVTKSTTSLLAMTALDTTNLRITFTAPTSGNILWRIKTCQHGSTTFGQVLLGVMEDATVKARSAPVMGNPQTGLATACVGLEANGVITGLTPGNSYIYDAAYAVQVVAGAGGLKYGGPNDTTTDNAFGGIAFEIWEA